MAAIKIEISRSHMDSKWNLRIGDLEGNTTMYNLTFDEVLDEIANKLRRW